MSYSARGRGARAKLSETDARNIRLRASKFHHTPRQMAPEYGVGVETVRRVLRWETFAYLSEVGPGAPAEEWKPAASDVAASQARLQAKLEEESIGSGLARLERELKKKEALLGEFTNEIPGGITNDKEDKL